MKKLHFRITIQAPPALVWTIMLDPDSYRTWTTPFCEGSHYEGSWNAGDRLRFLTPDGQGMVSLVAENRPHEYISLRHLGVIENGVEDLESAQAQGWAGATEEYTLTPAGQGTEVAIAQDILDEYEQAMQEMWPAALAKLKELCEEAAEKGSFSPM